MGSALKQASSALNKFAVTVESQEQSKSNFDTQAKYIEFSNAERRRVVESSENVNGLGAAAFETDTLKEFDTQARTYFNGVPDDQKPAVDLKLRKLRWTLSNAAYAKQTEAVQQYYSESITTNVNNSLVAVRDDPTILEGQFEQVSELINAADIDDSKKRQAISAARSEMVEQAIYGHAAKGDFKAATGLMKSFTAAAIQNGTGVTKDQGGLVDKIIGIESGGKANAKNPRSTATGAGQFIDSTWLNMMAKHRPGLARRMSKDALLELRKNPGLAREMTARYAEENVSVLKAAGIEPTAGNVYLAHFLGPGGAKTALKNSDDTALSAILPADVMKANPFLKERSVGWLRNWSSKKMGKASVTTNVEIGPKWVDRVNRKVEAIRTNTVNDASTAARDTGMQAILMTPEAVTEESILATEDLTTAHKNELIKALRSELKKGNDLRSGRIRLEQGDDASSFFNERDPDDRKAVDALATDPETLPGIKVGSPERAIELTRRTGIADRQAVRTSLSGLNSRDQGEFRSSIEFAAQLYGVSNRAFDGVDGAGQLKDYVRDYNEFRRNGYSPEEAAQSIFDVRHPEGRGNVTQLTSSANEYLKAQELTPTAVVSAVGETTLGMSPDAALDGQFGPGIVADYKRIWKDQYIKSNGSTEYASLSTKQKMSQLYGTSQVAGSSLFGMQGDFVKYPFENYYKPIDGAHNVYRADAATHLSKALGRDIKPDDVAIIADPRVTGDDIQSNKQPRFRLYYRTEIDGDEMMHTPVGDVFYQPDQSALVKQSYASKTAERLRRQRLEQAPDDVTIAIDNNGNEVLVDVMSREVVQDNDGVITPTGEVYVPPTTVRTPNRRAQTVNQETDFVQPSSRGMRLRKPSDFGDDQRTRWNEQQKSLKNRPSMGDAVGGTGGTR